MDPTIINHPRVVPIGSKLWTITWIIPFTRKRSASSMYMIRLAFIVNLLFKPNSTDLSFTCFLILSDPVVKLRKPKVVSKPGVGRYIDTQSPSQLVFGGNGGCDTTPFLLVDEATIIATGTTAMPMSLTISGVFLLIVKLFDKAYEFPPVSLIWKL